MGIHTAGAESLLVSILHWIYHSDYSISLRSTSHIFFGSSLPASNLFLRNPFGYKAFPISKSLYHQHIGNYCFHLCNYVLRYPCSFFCSKKFTDRCMFLSTVCSEKKTNKTGIKWNACVKIIGRAMRSARCLIMMPLLHVIIRFAFKEVPTACQTWNVRPKCMAFCQIQRSCNNGWKLLPWLLDYATFVMSFLSDQ